jgi:hypothetical protein
MPVLVKTAMATGFALKTFANTTSYKENTALAGMVRDGPPVLLTMRLRWMHRLGASS